MAAAVAILAGLLAAGLALRDGDGSSRRDLIGQQEANGPRAAPASAALQEAVAWVGRHVRPGTQVVVPDGVAGPAGAVVTTYREAGSAEPTGLLVNAGKPPAVVAALIDRSVPLATFGTGTSAVQVLDLSAGPRDQESRVQAGRDLLANPALTLDSGARAAVGAGRVDPRLLVLIAGLAARHSLTVELPMDPSDPGAVHLQANITTYDGSPAVGSNPAVDRLTNWLREQPPPFAPDRIRQQADAVAIQVLLPAEPGLLELGSFQTVQPD